jgi:hypothetical protein
MPKSTDVLDETEAAEMNFTAMCLFNLSWNDKVSQMALYNGKTTDLPNGDAAKVWTNMFKLVHAKIINKMNELKGEFVKSTIYSARDQSR